MQIIDDPFIFAVFGYFYIVTVVVRKNIIDAFENVRVCFVARPERETNVFIPAELIDKMFNDSFIQKNERNLQKFQLLS